MTATVIPFSRRRSDQLRAEGCQACACRADGALCYPHRLSTLADRLREDQAATARELLVSATDVAEVLADALAVLDGITTECLTATPHRPTNSTRGAR